VIVIERTLYVQLKQRNCDIAKKLLRISLLLVYSILYLGEWPMRSSIGSFVSFTFSTKFVFRVNQILTVIAVVQIQNLRQAFMSKSHNLMSRNVNI
jgi:hypothetical protein